MVGMTWEGLILHSKSGRPKPHRPYSVRWPCLLKYTFKITGYLQLSYKLSNTSITKGASLHVENSKSSYDLQTMVHCIHCCLIILYTTTCTCMIYVGCPYTTALHTKQHFTTKNAHFRHIYIYIYIYFYSVS